MPGQHRHLGPAATEPRRGQEQHLVGGRWADLAGPQPLTGGRHHVERPIGQRREQRPRRGVQPAGRHQRDRAVGQQVHRRSEQRLLQPGAEVARVVGPPAGRPPHRRPTVVRQHQGLVRGACDSTAYPAVVDDEHVQRPVDVDQLDQGPGADLGHQAVDVEPGVGVARSGRPGGGARPAPRAPAWPARPRAVASAHLRHAPAPAAGRCRAAPPAPSTPRRRASPAAGPARSPATARSSAAAFDHPRRRAGGPAPPARGRVRWPGRGARSCPACGGVRRARPARGHRRAAPRRGRRAPHEPSRTPARRWRASGRSAGRGTRPPRATTPTARDSSQGGRPGSARPAPRPRVPHRAAAPRRWSVGPTRADHRAAGAPALGGAGPAARTSRDPDARKATRASDAAASAPAGSPAA